MSRLTCSVIVLEIIEPDLRHNVPSRLLRHIMMCFSDNAFIIPRNGSGKTIPVEFCPGPDQQRATNCNSDLLRDTIARQCSF